MPICNRCREAAEGLDFGPVDVCSVCGQGPISLYDNGKVRKHKKPGSKPGQSDYWCRGSKRPPRESTGHDFCDGCPCQHRPKGSWNQRP